MLRSVIIIAATILSWFVSFTVVDVVSRLFTPFDASPRLSGDSAWPALMRWDSFHFNAIASDGYTYEHQWAFLPGTPFLMHFLRFSTSPILWPITLLVVACASTHSLYRLSLHHFPNSPSLALLIALLSLLPSSPATLRFAPYSEPFFTFLSYEGMLFAAKRSWLLATFCFTLATAFRSNGVLLSGYIIWGLVAQPFLLRKSASPMKVLYAAVLTGIISSPFIYHNYAAYILFCQKPRLSESFPEWCFQRSPLIYTYVQSKYWNVGFLRYWNFSQLPNFLIAAPQLVLLFSFSIYHVTWGLIPYLRLNFLESFSPTDAKLPYTTTSSFLTLTITPHVLHTIFLCITVLFFSHMQIILRLAAALPTIHWAAAWLLVSRSKSKTFRLCGSLWVWWSVIWGFASLGLWVAFLPPA